MKELVNPLIINIIILMEERQISQQSSPHSQSPKSIHSRLSSHHSSHSIKSNPKASESPSNQWKEDNENNFENTELEENEQLNKQPPEKATLENLMEINLREKESIDLTNESFQNKETNLLEESGNAQFKSMLSISSISSVKQDDLNLSNIKEEELRVESKDPEIEIIQNEAAVDPNVNSIITSFLTNVYTKAEEKETHYYEQLKKIELHKNSEIKESDDDNEAYYTTINIKDEEQINEFPNPQNDPHSDNPSKEQNQEEEKEEEEITIESIVPKLRQEQEAEEKQIQEAKIIAQSYLTNIIKEKTEVYDEIIHPFISECLSKGIRLYQKMSERENQAKMCENIIREHEIQNSPLLLQQSYYSEKSKEISPEDEKSFSKKSSKTDSKLENEVLSNHSENEINCFEDEQIIMKESFEDTREIAELKSQIQNIQFIEEPPQAQPGWDEEMESSNPEEDAKSRSINSTTNCYLAALIMNRRLQDQRYCKLLNEYQLISQRCEYFEQTNEELVRKLNKKTEELNTFKIKQQQSKEDVPFLKECIKERERILGRAKSLILHIFHKLNESVTQTISKKQIEDIIEKVEITYGEPTPFKRRKSSKNRSQSPTKNGNRTAYRSNNPPSWENKVHYGSSLILQNEVDILNSIEIANDPKLRFQRKTQTQFPLDKFKEEIQQIVQKTAQNSEGMFGSPSQAYSLNYQNSKKKTKKKKKKSKKQNPSQQSDKFSRYFSPNSEKESYSYRNQRIINQKIAPVSSYDQQNEVSIGESYSRSPYSTGKKPNNNINEIFDYNSIIEEVSHDDLDEAKLEERVEGNIDLNFVESSQDYSFPLQNSEEMLWNENYKMNERITAAHSKNQIQRISPEKKPPIQVCKKEKKAEKNLLYTLKKMIKQ